MEEIITIEKTYTKKEAFERVVILRQSLTATENADMESEYNKLIDFCGIRSLI